MRMIRKAAIIPIYTTRGDAEAFLAYPYLYNRSGEWIGWVTTTREVYSVLGNYVGYLTNDPRILCKRVTSTLRHQRIPPKPGNMKINLPATTPLAPMMSELNISVMDVLLEEPERLHTTDLGELKEDLD